MQSIESAVQEWKVINIFRMATLKFLIEDNGNLVPASVKALPSRKQIQNLELKVTQLFKDQVNSNSIETNRLITSGMILDWKKFGQNENFKNQLLLKNGQSDENMIFSYYIEEWKDQQPYKVTYRWVRKIKKAESPVYLVEEEHIYNGTMKAHHKHGKGIYLIVKRYSDNSEKHQFIKGEWICDILERGTVSDQNGNERIIKNNMIHMRSAKNITAYIDQNQKVSSETEKLKKSQKQLPVSRQLKSRQKSSFSLIVGKKKVTIK